ncbi:MAG TPA: hypothetical protein VE869_17715 [Gemmatimonas sp.]|nr:hypothetical protein [Gemmatimonas sp.]
MIRRLTALSLFCASLALGSIPLTRAGAQVRSVQGRVLHPDRENGDTLGMAVTPNAWVTLHRVGKDDAGPIDSVRTDPTGTYRFKWTPRGAVDAVYFASVTWDGIAYFTPPLRAAVTTGGDAEITVFDTTSVAFPLSVRGRHLIVSAADSTDQRTVIEVFELSNDSVRALVSGDGDAAAPTWSVAVPMAAKDARVSEGDIAPDAFAFTNGRVSVYAPIAPGLKQISFSYKIPASSFPLSFNAERGAVVFEVLLEESQGTVTADGFTAVAPVTLEGRIFKRFLAQDLKADTRVLVELSTTRMPGRNLYIAALLAAVGFLMLLALSRAVQRRTPVTSTGALAARRGAVGGRAAQAPMHERLAQEIAALDATYGAIAEPSPSVRNAYDRRRAELVDALSDALAETSAAR